MEVGESEEYFDDVEASDFLTEATVLLDEAEELSAGAVLHDEDDVFLCLEGLLEFDEEGVLGVDHDVPLVHDDFLLLVPHDHFLVDELHGVELVVELVAHQEHCRKAT